MFGYTHGLITSGEDIAGLAANHWQGCRALGQAAYSLGRAFDMQTMNHLRKLKAQTMKIAFEADSLHRAIASAPW